MCGRRSVSVLLSLCLFGPSFPALSYSEEAPGNSPSNSQTPETLWQTLLEQTSSLPENFGNFKLSLEDQVNSLSISNESLQKTNDDLTTKNASLMESLEQSETRAETSESKSTQLQTDLDASMLSITQAQKEAKALEFKLAFFKVGFFTFGIGTAALGAYEAGRYFKLWK